MAKVSVVLPVYKADETIERAIKSVLEQSYNNIELIVVENGPKGNTKTICKKLSDNIIYVYSDVANVSRARNIGIEKATGRYLAFIDADDRYEEKFLEVLVAKMENAKAELVTCGYKTSNGKIERRIDNSEKLRDTTDIQEYLEVVKESYLFNELWNKLYITSIIKEQEIKFDEKFELGEDFIFNLDYLKYVKKACFVNELLYVYTEWQEGLKLKYRKNKFEIEYELTKYLEKFYKEKSYSMEYIYNRFARVYYNGFLNIFQANNMLTKKQKEEELDRFVSSKQYKDDLNFLKDKVTDKKFKIAINYFFLKGKNRIKLFMKINNLRKGRT